MRSESEMIEILKQELEALEMSSSLFLNKVTKEKRAFAIDALRTAIAEATIKDNLTVEPVAYVAGYYNGQLIVNFMDTAVILPPGMALYRAPSEWVGLTDEEMEHKPAIYPEEARDLGLEEIPYYTRPPRREWVGLTDEEIEQLMKWPEKGTDLLAFARAIEAKLKEKNS